MIGSLSVNIENENELLASFDQMIRGVLDLPQIETWDWVQSEFYKVEKEIFGSANYGQWPPLSAKYAKAKSKKYGGPTRILIGTGGMYREFTSDAGNVTKEPGEMTFTFSSPAAYHMSKAPRSKMPYRSSIDLNEEQKGRLLAPIGKKLRQLADNAKLRDIRGF